MNESLRKLVPECGERQARMFLAEILARDFDEADVAWGCAILPEIDSPSNGHFASGDAEADAKQIAWIYSELEAGNVYAWFHCTVTATWKDHTGTDHLGCCSYRVREDFWKLGDYAEDMMYSALVACVGEAGVALAKDTVKAAVAAGMERTEPNNPLCPTFYTPEGAQAYEAGE